MHLTGKGQQGDREARPNQRFARFNFAMLEWVAGGTGARFALIVHHDDAVREFAYDREAGLAKLDRGLDEGKRGWTMASMKNNWKRVFPFDAEQSEELLVSHGQGKA